MKLVSIGYHPIAAPVGEQVVERRGREAARDCARRGVALADQNRAVLVAELEGAEPEETVFLDRPAHRKGVLLAIKWRRRVGAIKGRRQALQLAVAEEERPGAVILVRAC